MSVAESPLVEGSTASLPPEILTPEILSLPHPLANAPFTVDLDNGSVRKHRDVGAGGDEGEAPEELGKKLQEFFQTSLKTVHSRLGESHMPSPLVGGMNGLSSIASSPSVSSLVPPKPKRRKGSDLAEHEKWYCPFHCGKFYRKTSTRSIRRHRSECAFQIRSAIRDVQSVPASSPALSATSNTSQLPSPALVAQSPCVRSLKTNGQQITGDFDYAAGSGAVQKPVFQATPGHKFQLTQYPLTATTAAQRPSGFTRVTETKTATHPDPRAFVPLPLRRESSGTSVKSEESARSTRAQLPRTPKIPPMTDHPASSGKGSSSGSRGAGASGPKSTTRSNQRECLHGAGTGKGRQQKAPIHEVLQVFLLKSLQDPQKLAHKAEGKLSSGAKAQDADKNTLRLKREFEPESNYPRSLSSSSSKQKGRPWRLKKEKEEGAIDAAAIQVEGAGSPSPQKGSSSEARLLTPTRQRKAECSPVQHLEKMLPQEQLMKILEKENKWKAADAKLRRRHTHLSTLILPPPAKMDQDFKSSSIVAREAARSLARIEAEHTRS
eukprot:CAMPEP_0184497314 /NCGR_PEP_ID=MMETSP0113_2-20130426/36144_1 /TAXON_ID=91329 /ORGANISM="Norrisiella sphaerica, Strain BC52" /LENGTH=549 /DNA_ID=CAMNT_0026884347 /DNA_START=53 /DNA_END=1698 /DNA_ORIENTATION=+